MTKEEAVETLKRTLVPGHEIYPLRVNHGSKGRPAYIILHVGEGQIEDITWLIANACGCKRNSPAGSISCDGWEALIARLEVRLDYNPGTIEVHRL
jgi:hypothetical protein